jgi:hypothetical protein
MTASVACPPILLRRICLRRRRLADQFIKNDVLGMALRTPHRNVSRFFLRLSRRFVQGLVILQRLACPRPTNSHDRNADAVDEV